VARKKCELATTENRYIKLCAKARGPELEERAQDEAKESYQPSMSPRNFVSKAAA